MELGPSLVLIAIGAILKWAVTATVSGVNLHTIGLIVFIVGIVGFVLSLIWMFSRRNTTTTVVEQRPVVEPTYREVHYR